MHELRLHERVQLAERTDHRAGAATASPGAAGAGAHWRFVRPLIHDGSMVEPVAVNEFVTIQTEHPPRRRELHAWEERRARLAAFEFRADEALFRLAGPPDAFSGLEGGVFATSDGRRFRVSWVKPLPDDAREYEVQRVYRAVALTRRLS